MKITSDLAPRISKYAVVIEQRNIVRAVSFSNNIKYAKQVADKYAMYAESCVINQAGQTLYQGDQEKFLKRCNRKLAEIQRRIDEV